MCIKCYKYPPISPDNCYQPHPQFFARTGNLVGVVTRGFLVLLEAHLVTHIALLKMSTGGGDDTIVSLQDVVEEDQQLEQTANAVLGDSDDTKCTYPKVIHKL